MKKCTKCSKEYDDSKQFCPVCGGQLAPVSGGGGSTHGSKVKTGSWFEQWGGIVLTIVGLLLEWEINAIFGFAVAVVGAICGFQSSNGVNKVASMVIGVIAALLFVIYILV